MPDQHDIVYVVDDDANLRYAISVMLEEADLIGETFGSAAEFWADFDPLRAGCIVLDISLPDIDGLELCHELRNTYPDISVIIVTGYGDAARARSSFKMGALDFLEKPFTSEQLVELIRIGFDLGASTRQRQSYQQQIQQRFDTLSERELEVLDLVVTGELNKQMASTLGLHERTIEYHRKNLMNKMCAKNLPDLVRMAMVRQSHKAPPGGTAGEQWRRHQSSVYSN